MTFVQNAARVRIPVRSLAFGLLAAGMFLAAGCSEEPECDLEPEGLFEFNLLTDTAFEGSVNFEASVTVAEPRFTDPPTLHFELRRTDNNALVSFDVIDIGFSIPLTVGETVELTLERRLTDGDLITGYGLLIEDDLGVRYLAVSDITPQELVFPNGYGPLDLAVFIKQTDCEPRIENTREYRDVTNRQLEFVLNPGVAGSEVRRSLYHTQSGSLGPWEVHVTLAERSIDKIPENLAAELSFFLQRPEAQPE